MKFKTTALAIGALCSLAIAGAQQPEKAPPAGDNKGASEKKNEYRFDAKVFLTDHDANKDGKLSKDELPAAAQDNFAQIDTNKDGAISAEELQAHADRMAAERPQLIEIVYYTIDLPEEKVTTQELQTAYDQLRKLDKNNDGKIDASEVKSHREERLQQRCDTICSSLDRNKDGKISKDEARGIWKVNFVQLDKNKDGMLDKEEIKGACTLQHGNTNEIPGTTKEQPSK